MMRALALCSLVACSAPPDPELAFVIARADELGPLGSTTAHLRSIGLVADTPAVQRAQVERALELGVRVIVLEPLAGLDATDLVARAHERGVSIVAYGREPITRGDEVVDALVTFDGYRAGALLASSAVAAIERGRITTLGGDDDDVAREIARGFAFTLAPYIARGDISIVDDVTRADAVLATGGAHVRSLSLPHAFVASVGGNNTDLVCAGRQQVDVRLDRAELAAATGRLVRRMVAGEDLDKDPQTNRLPNRRLPVELARVTAFVPDDCVATSRVTNVRHD